jgi:hypothetical protein
MTQEYDCDPGGGFARGRQAIKCYNQQPTNSS